MSVTVVEKPMTADELLKLPRGEFRCGVAIGLKYRSEVKNDYCLPVGRGV